MNNILIFLFLTLFLLSACGTTYIKQIEDFCTDKNYEFDATDGSCFKVDKTGNLTFKQRVIGIPTSDGYSFYFEKK